MLSSRSLRRRSATGFDSWSRNPGDYEPGRLYTAQAVDPGGPYPVLAAIEAKHGNEIAGTFTEG